MNVFLLLIFITGCASYPKYEGRFFERKIGKGLISTKYTGERHTAIEVTSLYSAFRALEYCSEKSHPVTVLIEQAADGKAVETIFLCTERSRMLNLHVRTFNEINLLTKDNKGGVEVAVVPEDSPNRGTLKNNDFLVAINGERVDGVAKMTEVVNALPRSEGEATIYRNGTELRAKIKTVENTNEHLARNKHVINRACNFPELAKRPLCQAFKYHQ